MNFTIFELCIQDYLFVLLLFFLWFYTDYRELLLLDLKTGMVCKVLVGSLVTQFEIKVAIGCGNEKVVPSWFY